MTIYSKYYHCTTGTTRDQSTTSTTAYYSTSKKHIAPFPVLNLHFFSVIE